MEPGVEAGWRLEPRRRVALGALCVVVLAAGAWLRASASQPPAPVPSEKVAPILVEEVERRRRASVFRDVQERARDAARHVVRLRASTLPRGPQTHSDQPAAPEPARPLRVGLAVAQDRVLALAPALGGETATLAVLADGEEVPAVAQAHEVESDLVLLTLSQPLAEPATLASQAPAAGDLVVGSAFQRGGRLILPGFVATVEEQRCELAPAPPPGTPVFTPGGEALALAGHLAGQAWRIGPAVDRLMRLRSSGRGLPRSIGIRFQDLDERLGAYLGGGGVAVVEVDGDGPAAGAGLRAGDVVLKIGEREVGTAAQAADLVSVLGPEPIAIAGRRAGRPLRAEVQPELSLHRAARAVETRVGVRADALYGARALAEAGIPPDARLLAPGDGPLAPPHAARKTAARRQRDLVVVLLRGQRYLAVVETGP